jgi:type VI secretion system protein ImpF
MTELTHRERLQPSLLDRLTDEEPDQKQESRNKRVLSPSRLRESVRRDLVWLFNASNIVTLEPEVAKLPHVKTSVINYGLPDFTGHTASSVDVRALERLLREAIWSFEPRLLKDTVRVRLDVEPEEMTHNSMTFSIEGELWAQPLPLRLFFRTEIDLETGEVEISEQSGSGRP